MNNSMTTGWVVMKFGGTSVSSAACWQIISEQVGINTREGHSVMVVVSALSQVTNLLTQLVSGVSANERKSLLQQIHGKHRDLLSALDLQRPQRFVSAWDDLERFAGQLTDTPAIPTLAANILACGELLSSAIASAALEQSHSNVQWTDARDCLAIEETEVLDPLAGRCHEQPDDDLAERLLQQSTVHVTQGFIAGGPAGQTFLLGRGGSDTSAACFAARLRAQRLEIWTDVPGVFSSDPRIVPEARLLRRLSYSEAQELASMGAKVLHPPSIHPARKNDIPVYIRNTHQPFEPGTEIGARSDSEDAQVKGVVSRSDITLLSMENPSMWRQAGFLSDTFEVFKRHGYSVDLISTSESTVTVSLDPQSSAHQDAQRFAGFLDELRTLCRVQVHTGCVSISLVGNSIRTILGRLSVALDVFQDRHVYMVTQSANDLNLTLVVDPEHATSLVRKLHQLLIASQADSRPEFGPSWMDLQQLQAVAAIAEPWWIQQADSLVELMHGRDAAYVYHLDTVRQAAGRLASLESVQRILYAVKANDHPVLLDTLYREGMRFECVSMAEVEHVLASVPALQAGEILFTPNFAPRAEYRAALEAGVMLTVDNAWAIKAWPELFAGRDLFLRLDLDTGYGHHKKVITSGADSKFGISLSHLEQTRTRLDKIGARVVGLHTHTGSGVANADAWREQLERFKEVIKDFKDVETLDLGGGFSVPDRRGQPGLDLQKLDQVLQKTLGDLDLALWLEPGRYLVSEAGVLLARVTQLKTKGQYDYLGISVGMNALIRPALYGAHHDIANLNRLEQPADCHYRVVGPICESGDVIGEGRFLPTSEEGDVMLIANAGAYGRVMASSYNRRFAPVELTL